MTGRILRLYPPPTTEITAGGPYEDLEFPPPGRPGPSRPYVILNMVSSLDGKTAVGGKSSRIGSETDRRAMRTLRSKADAVMIGAGTLRAERLSLGLDDPSLPQPLAVIVTATGADVPLESNLIEPQEVVVITTQNTPQDLDERLQQRASVLRVPPGVSGGVDLGAALKRLKAEHAINLLLVEGGPNLNHALISSNLADELFLTLAPKLLGGDTLTLLDGPAPVTRNVVLISVHLAGDELFLRYGLHPGPPCLSA